MDPYATLQRMLDALSDHDWEEYRDAAQDLLEWTQRGGFVPTIQRGT